MFLDFSKFLFKLFKFLFYIGVVFFIYLLIARHASIKFHSSLREIIDDITGIFKKATASERYFLRPGEREAGKIDVERITDEGRTTTKPESKEEIYRKPARRRYPTRNRLLHLSRDAN